MSCGAMPIAAKGKNVLFAPILLGPSMVTCEISRQFSPNATSAPITQNGPTSQEDETLAFGSIKAVGCTFMRMDSFAGSLAPGSQASLFPPPSLDLRPRSLSINWHDTIASATRLSPTYA